MKRTYGYYVLIWVSFLFSLGESMLAQSSPPPFAEKIDSYLNRELSKYPIPNLEVLLISPKGIVYTRSEGQQGGMDTPYYIGSVSKSLTAMGILTLIDQGKLNLDDPIHEILPSIRFTDQTSPVLLRHLLSHTSGISKSDGFQSLLRRKELKDTPFSIKLQTPPGTEHEYSNLNYVLLGFVIEAKTGLPFAEYMQESVFRPLGMAHSFATPDVGIEEALADQYQYYFGFPVKSKQPDFDPSAVPAGFIRSSAKDLGNYIQSQMSGKNSSGDSILSEQALKHMHNPWNGADYGYAMGWKKGSINDKPFLQHLGSTATSYSGIFLIPQDSLGLVFLTNSNSFSFSEEVLTGILQIALGGEGQAASSKEQYIAWGVAIWLIFSLIQFILKARKTSQGNIQGSKANKIRNLVLQILGLCAFIFIFPKIAQIPFGGFLQMRPDWGIAMLVLAGLSIILSLLMIFTHSKSENA